MEIIYLSLLVVFLWLGINLSKIRGASKYQYEVTPRLMLVISYFIYSISLPVSIFIFNYQGNIYDLDYMFSQSLGAFGILFGLWLASKTNKSNSFQAYPDCEYSFYGRRALLISIISLLLALYNSMSSLDWSMAAMLGPRIYDSASPPPALSIFGHLFWVLAVSSTVLTFFGGRVKSNGGVVKWSLLIAIIFIMFYLLRGERLYAGMMILPLVCIYYFSRPVSIFWVLIISFSLFLAIYTIGFIRDVGFFALTELSFDSRVFDPLSQEFGTNYSVFNKWRDMGGDASFVLGKTYTTDVLLNFIPSFFWSNRPVTAAVQFSMDFYGVEDISQLKSAWGFSPVVEALSNFGSIGVLPIFALTAYIITSMEEWLKRCGPWGISCYAFLVPVVINWNRMDFAITAKMFLVYAIISRLLSYFIFKKNRMKIITDKNECD